MVLIEFSFFVHFISSTQAITQKYIHFKGGFIDLLWEVEFVLTALVVCCGWLPWALLLLACRELVVWERF